MKKKHDYLIFMLPIALFIGMLMYSMKEYRRIINDLRSIQPQHVTMFRVRGPNETAVTFKTSEPIIHDFLHALTDIHSYLISRDSSEIHQRWFLEVTSGGLMVEIAFYIPSGKNGIVVGQLGEFTPAETIYYGDFQSRQLYHWYKKYSHRWLEPEDAQSTPTPQPKAPSGE